MKRFSVFAVVLLVAFAVGANAAWIDPELEADLASANPDQQLAVYVVLKQRVNLDKLLSLADARGWDRAMRHEVVVTRLQEMADDTQGAVLSSLEAAQATGDVTRVRSFWIDNAIGVTATPYTIKTLASDPAIASIYPDAEIELIAPVDVTEPTAGDLAAGVENGITSTGAPSLWALGIDGSGALACDQDTGADGTHPALADRWRGLDAGVDPSAAWFDPTNGEAFPTDSGSHGTHTLGTMVGVDGSNQIGMAPGAEWIGAKTDRRLRRQHLTPTRWRRSSGWPIPTATRRTVDDVPGRGQ